MKLVAPNMTQNLIIMTVVCLATLTFLLRKDIMSLFVFLILLLLFAFFVVYVYIFFYRLDISGCVLMKNYDVIEMPVRLVGLTERFAREGIEFMKNQTVSGNPFLLMMSWGHTHTFLAPSEKFSGRTRQGRYGDCVEELDWGIGLILQALEDIDEQNNTLVYFSSDQGGSLFELGPKGQVDGGYNGIYRGEFCFYNVCPLSIINIRVDSV